MSRTPVTPRGQRSRSESWREGVRFTQGPEILRRQRGDLPQTSNLRALGPQKAFMGRERRHTEAVGKKNACLRGSPSSVVGVSFCFFFGRMLQ